MNHHKLKCYEMLLKVAKAVPSLVWKLPRGEGYLSDQFKRAIASSILNLAEGNGRSSTKDRNRFFDISLGSIAESISCIDIILAYGYISSAEANDASRQLKVSYIMIRNLKR